MIFPNYLRRGDWIGVSAMSNPVNDPADKAKFNHAANVLSRAGFGAVFTNNVFADGDAFGRSGSGPEKGYEFNALVSEGQISVIYAAKGGDNLIEMLPYVDIRLFKKNPKWVQGYSDVTSLLYYLTTKGDVATAYGACFSDLGMEPWDDSVHRGLGILTGDLKEQQSFDYYQDGFKKKETLGSAGYSKDALVEWKIVADGRGHFDHTTVYGPNANMKISDVEFDGRLIGGCLDVLLEIAGTRFDGTAEFLEKYKENGIIWYLESFNLNCEQMMEGLWKLRQMGWFEGVKGFIFGRPLFYSNVDFEGNPTPTYADVLRERLGDLNVPIIMDADIGHKGPQFVMINGAMANVRATADGKGSVIYFD